MFHRLRLPCRNSIRTIIAYSLSALFVAGCASFSSTNKSETSYQSPVRLAQFKIERDRGSSDNVLMVLALSGGGSRAAYLSAMTMLRMEKVFAGEGIDLLKEIDVVTSVSGGSLPAAYYAISQDTAPGSVPARSGRVWDEKTVQDLMSRNYVRRWVGNWFWPDNILKYWFTAYDRSDIMAQTFADNLYDTSILGTDLSFQDMNPERPYLIINATNATEDQMGETFTFTSDDFSRFLKSDIYTYEIARAVMASAAFPSVFNYMTLRDYRTNDKKYLHVFDGGNTDNLGLKSTMRLVDENSNYRKIIVILVDAFIPPPGISSSRYDPRGFFDYAVDLNFLDSFDSLLLENRKNMISMLEAQLKSLESPSVIFYHLQFSDLEDEQLKHTLYGIKTDFKISAEGQAAIEQAVARLVVKENTCLQGIKTILQNGQPAKRETPYCTWAEKSK
jgi:NTE family protein